jgi:hypothetical protein
MEDALEAEGDRLRITTGELEAKNAQLDADLRRAREVQLALLPREKVTLTEFRPLDALFSVCSADHKLESLPLT